MMGSMRKHMNTLSYRNLLKIETGEHGKKVGSAKTLSAMEQKEHGLSSKPSLAQMKRAEAVEHSGKKGLITKPSNAKTNQASTVYKANRGR